MFKLLIWKVNALIDEIIIGGHVIETKISEVLSAFKATAEYAAKAWMTDNTRQKLIFYNNNL